MAIHVSDCDYRCPSAAYRTISINVLNTDGHSGQFVIGKFQGFRLLVTLLALVITSFLIGSSEVRARWRPALK